MAERTSFSTIRDATITISDGDSPANTYTLRVTSGSMDITQGDHDIVRATDTAGDHIGPPRKGGQAGTSQVSIEAMLFDPGGNGSETVLADLANQSSGYVGSASWVSTQPDSEFKTFDFSIALADLAGGDKGAEYTLSDCMFSPGVSITFGRDGLMLSGTIESPDAQPTVTRNA